MATRVSSDAGTWSYRAGCWPTQAYRTRLCASRSLARSLLYRRGRGRRTPMTKTIKIILTDAAAGKWTTESGYTIVTGEPVCQFRVLNGQIEAQG